MEVVYKENKIITPLVGDGKFWIRVVHDMEGTSDFLSTTKRRTSKGTIVMEAALKSNHIIQICNGSERAHFKLQDGVVTPVEAWQVSKQFPIKKKIKITLEIDLENQDLIKELLEAISKING